MAGEAAAVSPSTVHVAISRYVPTPKNLQVTKHTTLGFFLFGQFDFFSLLEKLREDVATAPFQPGPPRQVKYPLFLLQNKHCPISWGQISFVLASKYPKSPPKVVETSSVSYEDVLATTVINKVGPPSRNILPSESSCSCLVVWHQLVGTKLVLIWRHQAFSTMGCVGWIKQVEGIQW